MAISKVTPADLRAAIARSGAYAYIIAARSGVNPIRLSRLVRGRERITEVLATKILAACEREASRVKERR
jgi:hypothetical protein